MKKITLSKETLRVLTAQEAGQVAGGIKPTLQPIERCAQPISFPQICPDTQGCPPATAGCPPATVGCPPATQGCPPQTVVTRPQAKCAICPAEPLS